MNWIIPFIFTFLIGCSGYPPTKNVAPDHSKVESKIIEQDSTEKGIEKYQPEKNIKEEKGKEISNQTIKIQNNTIEKRETTQKKVLLNVPIVHQMPELYNGCEVASITMLLQYAGIQVNKFDVAKKISKDDDLLIQNSSGDILHWGNPNHGFVGSITGKGKKGYGVYNKPIQKVIEYYLPKRSINLTGKSFSHVENQIRKGKPVVVLVTTSFTPPKKWDSWKHGKETIHGTMELHAVTVVGFDSKSVYVNDPYTGQRARKVNKESFIECWTSLGKQAVSYR